MEEIYFVKEILFKKFHFNLIISFSWLLFLTAWAVQRPLNSQIDRFTDWQIHGEHLALFDSVWLCMTLYDYVWLCMTMYDYVWLCMTMYEYAWLCMTMYDYVCYVWLCMTM